MFWSVNLLFANSIEPGFDHDSFAFCVLSTSCVVLAAESEGNRPEYFLKNGTMRINKT